ncbi:MAG TPA: tRNA preQ1(34) S-adenosylmethionine ribosyltransferase-isomerase QueA [Phycisphaerae bacterium]|nr:tRNA preQ1(34) S-adenosylmethionine ribosyltransferase-isomerase QueA [Phycisphaerae bacterium]
MRMSELDYHLPPERIAAHPVEPRDQSRLMVLHRVADRLEHRRFADLPEYLLPTDLLVVNDTRVLPARLELRKATGAAIPGLFVHELRPGQWQVLLRSRGKVRPGDQLFPVTQGGPGISPPYRFTLQERLPDQKGMWLVSVSPTEPARDVLARIGHVPLPPYIEKMRRDTHHDEALDREHYQTVYARHGASVAAPTAGLHFTPQLLARIDALGIRRASVELDVGLGTFLPVEADTMEAHRMHTETYAVPADTIHALRRQRAAGHRIVVVGTTAVRTLETTAPQILSSDAPPANLHGATDLKIIPGFHFRLTDALITNFHLPRSTLMALVAALIGLDRLHALYALAIRENYRFYSYGDAMLILP